MHALSIVPKTVLAILTKLDPQKGHGPDGIHPRLLKLVANVVAARLTHLFSLTLAQENVPANWRSATVSPIFKKCDKAK